MTREVVDHGRGGPDLGMELHKLVDYLGGCLKVVSLFGLITHWRAVGAGPKSPGERGKFAGRHLRHTYSVGRIVFSH
jgi:hypothetical protein